MKRTRAQSCFSPFSRVPNQSLTGITLNLILNASTSPILALQCFLYQLFFFLWPLSISLVMNSTTIQYVIVSRSRSSIILDNLGQRERPPEDESLESSDWPASVVCTMCNSITTIGPRVLAVVWLQCWGIQNHINLQNNQYSRLPLKFFFSLLTHLCTGQGQP
jgi:hypothetical protein